MTILLPCLQKKADVPTHSAQVMIRTMNIVSICLFRWRKMPLAQSVSQNLLFKSSLLFSKYLRVSDLLGKEPKM